MTKETKHDMWVFLLGADTGALITGLLMLVMV
jgi:hypothetical protein